MHKHASARIHQKWRWNLLWRVENNKLALLRVVGAKSKRLIVVMVNSEMLELESVLIFARVCGSHDGDKS